MQSCHILIPEVGTHLQDLMELIGGLDARETIAQIEVAADDNYCMLVFRHLEELSSTDRVKLTQFAMDTGFWLQLQPHGPDSIIPLYPPEQILRFKPLADQDIEIAFKASDFTQVNSAINQQMVKQALDFLDIQPEDNVLDLFCGLGNFTLPMAQKASRVSAVEGDPGMVLRARKNALEHGLMNTEYYVSDLTKPDGSESWLKTHCDKILLDPPRSGALEIIPYLIKMNAVKIVYVSCQPSTLVRDLKILVASGYRLSHLGLVDMFPQTAHVECMAVLSL